MDKEKTGKIIKEARIKKGYTQQELGDLVGVSNKAVSRWEMGESFPDVGILEHLAHVLNLKIEEIVLGEVQEKNSESVARELVRTAKLQAREKQRMLLWSFLNLIICLWLVFAGYQTFFSSGFSGGTTSFLLPTILVFGLLFLKGLYPEPIVVSDTALNKRNWKGCILILLSAVYSFGLMLFTLLLTSQGKSPFHMEMHQVGPFVNNQLIVIYLINVIFFCIWIFKNWEDAHQTAPSTYLHVAAIHLVLCYSDLLHHMDSFENILFNILMYSGLYVLVAGVFLFTATLVSKKNAPHN